MTLFSASSSIGIKAPRRGSLSHLDRPLRRLSQAKRSSKHQDVSNSRKKAEKKAMPEQDIRVNASSQRHYVFIGNINPSTTVQQMSRFLKTYCGNSVLRVTRRCSRGEGLIVGAQMPLYMRGPRDRQYASVEFTSGLAVKRALRMNGRFLNSCSLVVSRTAADLPETEDLINWHVDKLRGTQQQKMGVTPRPISNLYAGTHPTQSFINPDAPVTDRHRFFGYSFAKTVL